MHPNERLLTTLFECLNAHDHNGIAECYHESANFRDIAFTLSGKRQIHAMWDMICSDDEKGTKSDIAAIVHELSANDASGRAVISETYTFRETGRTVQNRIVSVFEFRDGKIVRQTDDCDAASWASQAFGGIKGFVAGHIEPIRRHLAMKKLKAAHADAF